MSAIFWSSIQRFNYWQISEILFKDDDKTRNKNKETESA